MRSAQISRKTNETDIALTLCLEGTGKAAIDTGIGFLNHMLTLFACHSGFDLQLTCKGDIDVDFHHSAEDIGICLGKALDTALGDRAGITRYGSVFLPMDEALVLAAVDICGRGTLGYSLDIPSQKIGDFDAELIKEFFTALVRELKAAVHLRQFCGENSHHIAEAAFKAFARAVAIAAKIDPAKKDQIPSSKGMIV